MVGVRKIYLEDLVPSARDMHIKIRRLLYEMTNTVVERCSEAAPDIEASVLISDEDCEDTILETEFNLPLSFGSSKKRKRPRRHKRKKNCNVDFLSVQTSEHNLYLCLHDGDNCYYPVRVVGVGATLPAGSRAWVVYLEFGIFAEVVRSTHIIDLPEDIIPEVDRVLEYIGGDTQSTQKMHHKYWDQRYRLFSRFDMGICIPDEESWFSVTPEIIGVYIAEKLLRLLSPTAVVLDCFSGCGGNAVHLAGVFHRVIAADIDPTKISALRLNAKHYNVADRLELIIADAFDFLKGRLLASYHAIVDVILLAPPWGGMEYADKGCKFDLHSMFTFGDGFDLVENALKICKNVVFLIPKNTPKHQLEEIASKFKTVCAVEDFYLHGKCKMTVAYIGPLFVRKLATKHHS